MKLALTTALLAAIFTFPATAQTTASSQSQNTATGTAQNAGVHQGIAFNSDASGEQKIKNVPSLGGNGFFGSFSPDNCMVSGGGTAVIAGFGGSVVTPIRDPQCSLLRTFERTQQAAATVAAADPALAYRLRQAATDMLCMVSDEARAALAHQGLCSDLTQAAAATIAPAASVQHTIIRQRINADGTLSTIQ
ncbi:exported hypothetical protein [Hyphomicrobiales bacterium]|nr:exported hypothetical protein [Hyphomicrobiales bacterium]CAH1671664.1 exported hypothetical protein [Hyphomicrobiales bacterium]